MRRRSVTYSAGAAFSALADPTRRAVLDLLRRGPLPAGRIASAFPVSRPAISKHLRLLRRAQLVLERRQGRHRLYRLNLQPLKALDSWLEPYRVFWGATLTSLKTFVESEYAKETGVAGTTGQSAKLRPTRVAKANKGPIRHGGIRNGSTRSEPDSQCNRVS